MGVEPKKHISVLKRTAHGGPDHLELEEFGLQPDDVVDFSANVNPYGPPDRLLEAVRKVDPGSYPDRRALSLRRAVAQNVGVSPEEVLPGNGVSELIWLLASAYLGETDSALVVGPTFGEYADAARAVGAELYEWRASMEDDFIPHVGQIADLVKEVSPKAVFLCNPNNPTGRYLGFEEVKALLESWDEGMLVLDEAYVSFVEGAWSPVHLMESWRVVIMRSLTKDCALAGIRLGYALAAQRVVEAMEKVQPPWSVNAMAQEAGCVAMSCGGYVEKSLSKMKEARDYMIGAFSELGLRVSPSSAHFFLVEVGDAADFRRRLLRRGFQVRDCASFGLPSFIRVSPRSMDECRKLMEAVSELTSSE
jgi:histidinol-phosphate aminotransferase